MITHYKAPFGWLELLASDKALQHIRFLEREPASPMLQTNSVTEQALTQLDEYFEGGRITFSVPLDPSGTPFQQSVWAELQHILYGKTINYGELAQKLGDPNKVRAVGRANGQNPIPIIIPCHRVIGANNNLVGYAGGIARKRYLLKHEGAILL